MRVENFAKKNMQTNIALQNSVGDSVHDFHLREREREKGFRFVRNFSHSCH